MQLREIKAKPEQQGIAKRRPPLSGRRARQGARPPPEEEDQGVPAGPAGTRGDQITPPTAPPRPTPWISAVSRHMMIKWQPFATWWHFLQSEPTNETCLETSQASRRGAGDLPGNQLRDTKWCIKCTMSACRVRYDSMIRLQRIYNF